MKPQEVLTQYIENKIASGIKPIAGIPAHDWYQIGCDAGINGQRIPSREGLDWYQQQCVEAGYSAGEAVYLNA